MAFYFFHIFFKFTNSGVYTFGDIQIKFDYL